MANHSPYSEWQYPFPPPGLPRWGVHSSPVICINSRTIEESCEDTSISTNGVQGQRDPIHRGEQEDRKGKYKCLMIAFSDTAIYPQNSTGGKTNMFLKVLYITQIIHKKVLKTGIVWIPVIKKLSYFSILENEKLVHWEMQSYNLCSLQSEILSFI